MNNKLEEELKIAINSAIAEASREAGKPVIDLSFDMTTIDGQVRIKDVFIVTGDALCCST